VISIVHKFKTLSKNKENKELLVHSATALIVRIAGAGASFVMNIIAARYLGAKEAGYFFLATSIIAVLATVGRIGADQTILRFIGIHNAMREWPEMHAVMRKMMSWTYLPLLIVTAVVCIFAKPISIFLFHKAELQWPLFWTSLSMPFYAAYNVYGMALQGVKKVFVSVTTLKIITPVFFILIVLVLKPADSSDASIYYVIVNIINLAFGYFWWKRNVPAVKEKVSISSSTLWQSCYPLWITAIMQQLTLWGGQLVAGIYVTSDQVAQLAVARNTTVLIVFILMAVNNVSAPRFAAMYRQGQMTKLKNYARNSTLLMTIVALPITLVIWFFPTMIMSLFGKDFTNGDAIWYLRILAIGQFINVITGSVSSLLIMSGHEKDLKNLRIINGVLAIVLAVVLTAMYGAIGSAISSAIATAVFNLMAVGQVKKRLGFNTMSLFGFK
jgi:O-antigen/teichoic acid export membrane protein